MSANKRAKNKSPIPEQEDSIAVAKIVKLLNLSKTIESRLDKKNLTLEEGQVCVNDIEEVLKQLRYTVMSAELYEYRRNALSKIELSREKAKNRVHKCQIARLEEELWAGKEREWQMVQEIEQMKSQLEEIKSSLGGWESVLLEQGEEEAEEEETKGGGEASGGGKVARGGRGKKAAPPARDNDENKFKSSSTAIISKMDTDHNDWDRVGRQELHELTVRKRLDFSLQDNFILLQNCPIETFEKDYFLAIKQPESNGLLLFKSKAELDTFVSDKMIMKIDDVSSPIRMITFLDQST